MAIFASPISGPVLRTVAETSVCSAAESFDVYHLECVPRIWVWRPVSLSGGQRTHADRVAAAAVTSVHRRLPIVKNRLVAGI